MANRSSLVLFASVALSACVTDVDDVEVETVANGDTFCAVDQVQLAPGSSVVGGGVGTVQIEIGRKADLHDGSTVGLVDFKGPFIYHPEKLLRFTCARTIDNGCETHVATSAMTYDTGDQIQRSLAGNLTWRHPSINVALNSVPIVMTDEDGSQYSWAHFREPEVKREFKYEPTYLNGRSALSAAVSTASRIEQRTWIDLDLSYGVFSLEIPEIGWREAQHVNAAGAIVGCTLKEYYPLPPPPVSTTEE